MRPQVSPPEVTDETPSGFRGGVLLGLKLLVPRSPTKGIYHVNKSQLGRLKIRSAGKLGSPACNSAATLPCPSREEAVVMMRISALLDLRPVAMGNTGGATTNFRITAEGPESQDLSLHLPRVQRGRHCLIVALTEDARPVIENQLPQHRIGVLFWLQVGAETENRCPLPSAHSDLRRVSSIDTEGACGAPILSIHPDRMYLDRTVQQSKDLWAFFPNCGQTILAIFIRNGRLLGRRAALSPFATPSTATMALPLISLRPSWYQVLSVYRPQRPAKGISAQLSEPVLVDAEY